MFTDPIKNLKQFGLKEDMIVVDLGAGTGFYSITAARMVPRGKVYAIEIIKDFLITIKNKAREFHLKNLECIWGNVENVGGTNLADDICDAVIASDVLSQVVNKDKFINEIKRILKKDGRVLLVDWLESFLKKENRLNFVSKEEVLELFKEKGFIFDREINASDSHYGIIFKK